MFEELVGRRTRLTIRQAEAGDTLRENGPSLDVEEAAAGQPLVETPPPA